jgi:hypothetical protein
VAKHQEPDQDDWEAQSAASDLARAHKHMSNKPLMKRVKKHLKAKAQATNALSQMLSGGGGAPGGGQTLGSAFGQG